MTSTLRSQLLDSFFSFSDEYDRYFSLQEASNPIPTEHVEDLETADSERQRRAVCRIVTALMGETEDRESVTARKLLTSGALPLLLNYAKIKALSARSQSDPDLTLEFDLRLVLTALFLVLALSPNSEIYTEIESLNAGFEEVFLALIKLSLEKTFIPMKKVGILLYLYLSIILPEQAPSPESHIKISKDLIQEIAKTEPRYCVPPANPTEAFYVSDK